MSFDQELKKDGIVVVKRLGDSTVKAITRSVAFKIFQAFPEFRIDEKLLFNQLSSLNMYIAKIPEGKSEANYFYKNSAIYFNERISENELVDFAVHECIHYLQEIKDNKNNLIRMGLCDYTDFKIYGLGLNEAAVQLMTAKILGYNKECVKYFDLLFETTSPTYYPLECCLVNQMAYIVGEEVLFKSTLTSSDEFKEKFISLTSQKAFYQIQNAVDTILYAEEEINEINNKLANDFNLSNRKVASLHQKINSLRHKITTTFMQTQNSIISNYFDAEFSKLTSLEGIDIYRNRLLNFKDYLASVDGYTYFSNYYTQKINDINDLILAFNNERPSILDMVVVKKSKISIIIKYIKKFFSFDFGKEIETDHF